jgi:hypothetical protein
MNLIRHIRRSAAVLVGLAGAMLAFAVPAFARTVPIPGDTFGTPVPAQVPAQVPVQVRTIVAGGMPGWQIALIAAGAALIAAALAILAYRMLAARRQAVTTAA